MEEKEEYYSTNNISGIIKGLAVLIAVLGIIASVIAGFNTSEFEITILGCVGSVLAVLGLYGFGELIGIMHDIRTNTEHIRDYFESEKK